MRRRPGSRARHRPPPFTRHERQDLGRKRAGRRVQIFFSYSVEPNSEQCAARIEMSEAANILLVDDEPGMLRYIRTLLEVDEHEVQTASTGEEAVERVQKGPQPAPGLPYLPTPGMDRLRTRGKLV